MQLVETSSMTSSCFLQSQSNTRGLKVLRRSGALAGSLLQAKECLL